MSMPLVPPFAVTASYQNSQYGAGSTQVAQSEVLSHLVTPPSTAVQAETDSATRAAATGFTPYSATNSVQIVTVNGTPTGGTFTLRFGTGTTTSLAYNASAATVQAALVALTSIGTGNATVAGNAGGPYTVTFAGTLAGTAVQPLTGNGSALTGGTSPTVTVSVTAAGQPAFVNQAVLNVKQQYDGIRNANDLASGMHS